MGKYLIANLYTDLNVSFKVKNVIYLYHCLLIHFQVYFVFDITGSMLGTVLYHFYRYNPSKYNSMKDYSKTNGIQLEEKGKDLGIHGYFVLLVTIFWLVSSLLSMKDMTKLHHVKAHHVVNWQEHRWKSICLILQSG